MTTIRNRQRPRNDDKDLSSNEFALFADAEFAEDQMEESSLVVAPGGGRRCGEGLVEIEENHLVGIFGGPRCGVRAARAVETDCCWRRLVRSALSAAGAWRFGLRIAVRSSEMRPAGERRGFDDGDCCGDLRRDGVEVVLINGDEERAVVVAGKGGFVFGVEWGGGVEDEEDDVSFGHGFAGFCYSYGFGFVGGVAEAGRVGEFDGDAFEGDALGDEVARGAGSGGDDGAVALDEAIEERGFACVGAAYDG